MQVFRVCVAIFCLISGVAFGQISITEICPANADIICDPDYFNFSGWVELYNSSDQEVPLTDYSLSDDPADPKKWVFPRWAAVPAQGYLLVWCDEGNDDLHTNFSLSAKGGRVVLTGPYGGEAQRIDFPVQHTNTSYGQVNGVWGYMANPTPLRANEPLVASRRAGAVRASIAPGRYGASVAVGLATDEPATIRFTIDGSDPGPQSRIYSRPILAEKTMTIKARSFDRELIPGPVAVFTYFINERPFSLPVVSLTTQPAYLWDNRIGIYADGTNGTVRPCYNVPVNWNQDWERHGYLELFSKDGVRLFGQDTDFRVSGGCSRNWPQKPFALRARNKYGDNEFEYPFFAAKQIDEYGGLFIRNSGNDQPLTMFRDALLQGLVAGQLDVDYQAYQPAAFYLNGEYWGIQNLREKVDADYIKSNYGIDADDVDLLELNGVVIEGSGDFYHSYLDGLNYLDLADSASFGYIDRHIDVQEYINYMVTQIYCANLDWPGNNIKFWRQRSTKGKFRWILHDLDFGFDLNKATPSSASHPTLEFATDPDNEVWPNPAWSTFHFRKLLENPVFRSRFIETMNAAIDVTFDPERVIRHIDSLQSVVRPEMYYHRARWGGSMEEWTKEVQLLREFAVARNAFMKEHVREFFDLGRHVDVSLRVTPGSAGTYRWNRLSSGEAVSYRPYPSGMSYRLEARPAYGYRFKEWRMVSTITREMPLVNGSAPWQYFDLGYAPDTAWVSPSFGASGWKQGVGEFGFGDGDEATLVDYGADPNDKRITTYFRTTFYTDQTEGVSYLKLRMKYDDGVIVYLNGREVLRENMRPGPASYATLANGIRYGEEIEHTFRIDKGALQQGVNAVAAEVHQITPQSSDLSFAMELWAVSVLSEYGSVATTPLLQGEVTANTAFEAVFEPTDTLTRLVINEIGATKVPWITDNYGQAEDWIELFNPSDHDVSLSGFYITDNFSKKDKFQLQGEGLVISAGGYLVLWADEDQEQGNTHLNFKLSADGEQVGLYELQNGTLITHDELEFGYQFDRQSLARFPDGTGRHVATDRPTPGAPNVLDTGKELEVVIYPNPFESYLHIESKSVIDWIMVYDFSARIVSQFKPDDPRRIDLYHLQPGMHIFKIFSGPDFGQYKVIKH